MTLTSAFTIILAVLLALVVGATATYLATARADAPSIDILQPVRTVGATGRLDVAVETPGGRLGALDVTFVQNGRQTPLFSLASPGATRLQQETAERVRLTRGLGATDVPDLKPGPGRVIVRAARPVLFGLREARTIATRDVEVRLEPPRVTIVSTRHDVRHGGAALVVYRVTPPEAASGVIVDNVVYPGFPAAGVHVEGVSLANPSLKVAFFALLYDQNLDAPIHVFARDEAGNTATVPLEHRPVPTPFGRRRVELNDRFLTRVVQEILPHAPELGQSGGDVLAAYLAVNGELRRKNADQIARLAAKTAPDMLWRGPFRPLSHGKVEAGFAVHRTYFYRGREVDQQVHLGFDLAVTANVPVRAANRGRVAYAAYLGIYGNTVILDHGLGVQSLYAHLSSPGVRVGDSVDQGQEIGRSGGTGLAVGDHLHFTILVGGRMVSPVEWWDPRWIEDRIVRKLREAGAK